MTRWGRPHPLLVVLLLALVACTAAPVPPTPRPTAAPTQAPSPPPSPSSTSTPVPTPVPTLALATATPVPVILAVAHTNGGGANIRKDPATGAVVRAWPDGTAMLVVGPDRDVSGKTWKNVQDPDGTIGWVSADFLVAIVATPAPTPPGTATPIPSPTPLPPTATPVPPTSAPIPPTSTPAPPTPAPAPPTVSPACVASVAAEVKYPQLGGGTQTLYVTALNAAGQGVAGATGSAFVQYSTTSRTPPLPATAADGSTAVAWSVGGPRGVVLISVTETGGGCTARGTTTFQGR